MKKSIYLILILSCFFFTSCRNDEDDVLSPVNPNDNELVTTLKCVIKDSGNPSKIIEAKFTDPDGEGGKLPVLDTIRLDSDKSYNAEIWLLDESKTPTDTISYEIKKEGDEHQFFFSTSGGIDVSFTYSDIDKNGVPIGLISTWKTGAATTSTKGKIRITLKHQGKEKPDSGNGNINIGSTDIDVNFPTLIR